MNTALEEERDYMMLHLSMITVVSVQLFKWTVYVVTLL